MSMFIWLTKVEYDELEKEFDEIPIFINVDSIAYVNSKVVHLKNGETILCKESNNEIADLITNSHDQHPQDQEKAEKEDS